MSAYQPDALNGSCSNLEPQPAQVTPGASAVPHESEAVTDSNCILCEILAGKSPAYTVWADDEHVALLDRYPITSGHVVLVPRAHVVTVFDLDDAAYTRLFTGLGNTRQA